MLRPMPTAFRSGSIGPDTRPAALAVLTAITALCTVGAMGAARAAGAAAPEADPPPVVVTATRHAILEADAPAAMSVVTRREIEQRGAHNVIDAIRGETGVSLQGRSIGGRQVISLRGLDSRHTLFLVDGRRIGASDGVIGHSDFQYDWVAVEDIERIEVVRGPLSVLYGSEALGGVVNVITRAPGAAWSGGATLEGSRAAGERGGDGQRAAAQASGPLAPRVSLRAGAARSERDAIASVEDPRISELEGRDKREGWFGLAWRPADGHRLDAELRRGREERSADARERGGGRRYHETTTTIDRRFGALGWDAQWGGPRALATLLRAYRSLIDVENQRTEGVAANPPQRMEDAVLEGQLSAVVERQAWTTGFEARNEALEDPGLPGGRSLAQHRSLYLQDEWSALSTLRLTLGLRHDRHSLYGQEWSPRAYAVWRADASWTVKGGYGHGFKAPNLKQIVPGARREGPNLFFGNPDLEPETSDSVELGVGWQQAGRELQLMVFGQRIEDLIEVELLAAGPVPGTGTYTYRNLARARLSGLEAGAMQPLGAGLGLGLSYVYLDARDGDGRRLEKRPRHSATLRLDGQRGPWRAGARVEYSADQLLPGATATAPPQPAPSLTLVDAYLIRALPAELELALGVDNLTDVRLADESPLFPQAEPPRTWRLTLRGRW
jgi:outer membrane receptor for ferrienterochelin and colicins